MLFADVIGLNDTKQKLLHSLHSGKVPHAQLFVEREGSGALALALATATYLHCEQKQENDSCGVCNACKKNEKLIHADVHFSFPFVTNKEKRKELANDYIAEFRKFVLQNVYNTHYNWLESISDGENKQGNISVKECHEIIRKLTLTCFESDKKVMILWMAEFLQKEGNTLLKLIEEPPPNTYILLIAHDEARVLPTILSRCQTLRLPKIEHTAIEQYLLKNNIDAVRAKQIARQADGNVNEVLQRMHSEAHAEFETLRKWLQQCYKKGDEYIEMVDYFCKLRKDDQKRFWEFVLDFLHEYIMVGFVGSAHSKLNDHELITAQKLQHILPLSAVLHMIELVNHIIMSIERNAHSKTLYVYASIKMRHLFVEAQTS